MIKIHNHHTYTTKMLMVGCCACGKGNASFKILLTPLFCNRKRWRSNTKLGQEITELYIVTLIVVIARFSLFFENSGTIYLQGRIFSAVFNIIRKCKIFVVCIRIKGVIVTWSAEVITLQTLISFVTQHS